MPTDRMGDVMMTTLLLRVARHTVSARVVRPRATAAAPGAAPALAKLFDAIEAAAERETAAAAAARGAARARVRYNRD